MTQPPSSAERIGGAGSRRLDLGQLARGGLVAAVVAAVGNVLVYFLARDMLDVSFVAQFQGDERSELAAWWVAFVSAAAALLATGLFWLLARFTRRPLRVFQLVAVIVLLLSLSAPFTLEGASGGLRVALLVMHVVEAAAIVGVLSAVARRQAVG